MTGQKFEGQLMLVADQTTPYRNADGKSSYAGGSGGLRKLPTARLKAKGD
jgi:hypothetical protein